ncbi:MAG: GAP family protein [Actinocatenispora sp.]
MDLLTVLPMAIVMIAGPQIVSAFFFATSDNARRVSLGYVCGVAVAVLLGISVVYWLIRLLRGPGSSGSHGSGSTLIDWIIVALLVVLAVIVFLRRKKSHPPKWMTTLQSATPKFSFRLGFLLFLLMPTDVVTMLTVGGRLAREGDPWWHSLPFVALTLLLVALPILVVLLFGQRAERLLPKIRDWMTAHSWVISEIVVLFFLVVTLAGI